MISNGVLQSLRSFRPPNNHWGRVEIYHNGQFGTICNDFYTIEPVENAAQIICNQLGYTHVDNGDGVTNSDYIDATPYGRGEGIIWLDDVVCLHNVQEIANCTHAGWGNHNCGQSEYISIECSAYNGQCMRFILIKIY